MADLIKLKELVLESNNRACFVEREKILGKLEAEMENNNTQDKYAVILSKMLAEVSTPIIEDDYFVGRVVEDLPEGEMKPPNRLLCSRGHMSFDYAKVLKIGLKGILEEIKISAQTKGDEDSLSFAHNAEIVVTAIRDYANRYANEAAVHGMTPAAKALRIVPYEPAYDFYSALQGIWIIHMIASCYVGDRDYAFGRFDSYMFPFYEKAIQEGETRDALCELLAGFFIKTNEICGRTTYNYQSKPVPCQASKQYVNIGGEEPNEFSNLVLDAAMLSQSE